MLNFANKVENIGLNKIDGPLLFLDKNSDVGFDETVIINDRHRGCQVGRVVALTEDKLIVQVFGNTVGLSIDSTTITYTGEPVKIKVDESMLGRIFDGLGRPFDDLPDLYTDEKRDVSGLIINPIMREYPRDFIQTGISSIDCLMTLIRGQKLPIFSGNGLPHDKLVAQIVRQATLKNKDDKFTIVFAAMGVKYDVARYFIESFEASGVISKVVMYLSLADSPSVERLITPRSALTAAEYLAYEKGQHVLVIMTDMTNYCEALREISTARVEIPSRKGYPGYLYSDLASLYERAGRIKGREGSITQLPIISMPNDDITHPIPDVTGYITEGQIVLDRQFDHKGIYPPVNCLSSLSRLMKDGIGEGMTRDDHKDVSSQVFALYGKVIQLRELASVIGSEELSDLDKKYLVFGEEFEKKFLKQSEHENRSLSETLDICWELFSLLPRAELYRIDEKFFEKYMGK